MIIDQAAIYAATSSIMIYVMKYSSEAILSSFGFEWNEWCEMNKNYVYLIEEYFRGKWFSMRFL
jgi:hypothetical protein